MSRFLSSHDRISRWIAEGPALFAAEVMGAEPTWQQWDGGEALAKRGKVSVRSGHGTGKSAEMAWIALWGMTCFPQVKIPVTAPTSHQLQDVLWSELALWHRRMPPELRDQFEWKSDRFERKDRPAEAFAAARTSRKEQPEALQGFHAPTVIFLIDEASGIPDEVFQVVEGALSADGAYVFMAANPTKMAGYFYDSHHRMRANWAALHWNGEDSPLVSKSYVAEMAQKYGAESAIYRIRVRGDFAGNPDGVIPLELIESAIDRAVEPFGPWVWGLDVARFGEDRTALCKRRSNAMPKAIKYWQGKDTMQTAGLVKDEYDAAHPSERPVSIFVDVIGLGAGVVDRCRELGLPVVGVNVAESPAVQAQYLRLRDELWFRAREWFAGRDVSVTRDESLIAELTLPTFRIESSGKKRVQSKDELKKDGVTSPDLADAFCLTFARGASAAKRAPIKYPRLSCA